MVSKELNLHKLDVIIDYHLNAMPIVNEQDRLIGIVSRKDILQAVINDPPLNLFT